MTRRSIVLLLVVLAAAALTAGAAALWLGGDDDSPAAKSLPAESPAPVDSKRSATVWAVGDGDGGPEARQVADLIERAKPDRVLYLGDVYDDGTPEQFNTDYRPTYGRFDKIAAPTPGNHDWPEHDAGYDPYWKSANPRIPQNRHYYRFRVGGWEILSLNSESGLEPGSPQMRWLKPQVRKRGTCRIAFWHRPFLNAGKHGDQEDVAPLWRTLRGRAAIVVNGHDHNMQQFKPKNGIVELISGGGGHGLYHVNGNDPRLAWDEDNDYGALRLDLRPGVAHFRFVSPGKGTVHRGTVHCSRG
jgi:hypothetical protein